MGNTIIFFLHEGSRPVLWGGRSAKKYDSVSRLNANIYQKTPFDKRGVFWYKDFRYEPIKIRKNEKTELESLYGLPLKPEGKNLLRAQELHQNMLGLGLNMEVITEKTLRRDAKRFGHKPPDSIRIKQTENQISYQRWFEDYRIVVHTSFNPYLGKKGGFTSIGGSGWVMVTEKITERVYVQNFKRTIMDSFINSLLSETEFLINRLNNRPNVEGTSLLYKIKQTYTDTVWENPQDETDTKYFYGNIPSHLEKYVIALRNSKRYYQEIVRPRKGITDRSRDFRKTWDK